MNKYQVFHYNSEEEFFSGKNCLIYYIQKKSGEYVGYNVHPANEDKWRKNKWSCGKLYNPNDANLLYKVMEFYE